MRRGRPYLWHRCSNSWYVPDPIHMQSCCSSALCKAAVRWRFDVHVACAVQSQGRGHPAQQPKLQHQPQHVAKASGGAQVAFIQSPALGQIASCCNCMAWHYAYIKIGCVYANCVASDDFPPSPPVSLLAITYAKMLREQLLVCHF